MARIETDEMALVTVLRVIVAPVVVPLVQVAILTYGIGAKFFQGRSVGGNIFSA